MNIRDIADQKVKKILENESKIDFHHFLTALRIAYGRSRRNICKEINFSEMRMFCLENGLFRRPLEDDELNKISSYYGLEPTLLITKAQRFMTEGKNKPQGNYVPRRVKT